MPIRSLDTFETERLLLLWLGVMRGFAWFIFAVGVLIIVLNVWDFTFSESPFAKPGDVFIAAGALAIAFGFQFALGVTARLIKRRFPKIHPPGDIR